MQTSEGSSGHTDVSGPGNRDHSSAAPHHPGQPGERVAGDHGPQAGAKRERPNPVPRRMDFPFDESIPRHWFAGNPVATHVINGLNLLFPAGERFFVRSVRHYVTRVYNPELREQIKGFS